MCGIAGAVTFGDAPVSDDTVLAMREALAHRGPDDAGLERIGGAVLASRRLAVIDTGPDGHMPMPNENGTLRVVHNGEVYNFRELRRELEALGHRFRSATDTEVILHAYEAWGDDCVDHFRGMFAFALWDGTRQRLFCARDPLGVKPFHYARIGGALYFASELPALFPAVRPSGDDIDPAALDGVLAFGYVPPDRTVFRSIAKLPPGHTLVFDADGLRTQRTWRPALRPLHRLSLEDALDRTEALLRAAVRRRLVADVPLGCFLSGGIDSALVTAFAAQESGERLRTFSVGFAGGPERDDERPLARLVAEQYDTAHTDLRVRPADGGRLPDLLYRFGEPFADLSLLPVHQISSAAREHITVALSGDGGDESFCGYANVHAAHLAERLARWLPGGLDRLLASPLPTALLAQLGATGRRGASWLRQYVARPAVEQYDLANHWHAAFRRELYAPALRDRLPDPLPARALVQALQDGADALGLAERHLLTDLQLRLPGDYLPKVDIGSSRVALEVRSPFLDRDLVEFAARLPVDLRLLGGRQKGLLRRLAARHLPAALLHQPKRGFGPDLAAWLRGDWAGLVRELVGERLAQRTAFFQPDAIRRTVDEHLSGRANHKTRLSTLLSLELWWQLCVHPTRAPEAPPPRMRPPCARPCPPAPTRTPARPARASSCARSPRRWPVSAPTSASSPRPRSVCVRTPLATAPRSRPIRFRPCGPASSRSATGSSCRAGAPSAGPAASSHGRPGRRSGSGTGRPT